MGLLLQYPIIVFSIAVIGGSVVACLAAAFWSRSYCKQIKKWDDAHEEIHKP